MMYANNNIRDLIMSVKPIYASKIIEGIKTVELRRRFPKDTVVGATALIYSSSPVRAIVGYAQIIEVLHIPINKIWSEFSSAACITREKFDQYFDGKKNGYAIMLGNVGKLDYHLDYIELYNKFGLKPPQSYRYIGEELRTLLQNEQCKISH